MRDLKGFPILFSDIDGTLLNDDHRMDYETLRMLGRWIGSGHQLMLSSSRSPSGIYPILNRYHLGCGMVALGGAVIVDKDRNIIYENGMPAGIAKSVLRFIKNRNLPVSWNLYTTKDDWYCLSRDDRRVRTEEAIVEAKATEIDFETLEDDVSVGKILAITEEADLPRCLRLLKESFINLSITQSSKTLIEINPRGVSKASAVKAYCRSQGVPPEKCLAFGDNFNDEPMLKIVGLPVVMANAPQALREKFRTHTLGNNEAGIARFLMDADF